jgi:hypothetical protein
MHPIAKHLEQGVQYAPCMRFEHCRQQLAYKQKLQFIMKPLRKQKDEKDDMRSNTICTFQ